MKYIVETETDLQFLLSIVPSIIDEKHPLDNYQSYATVVKIGMNKDILLKCGSLYSYLTHGKLCLPKSIQNIIRLTFEPMDDKMSDVNITCQCNINNNDMRLIINFTIPNNVKFSIE